MKTAYSSLQLRPDFILKHLTILQRLKVHSHHDNFLRNRPCIPGMSLLQLGCSPALQLICNGQIGKKWRQLRLFHHSKSTVDFSYLQSTAFDSANAIDCWICRLPNPRGSPSPTESPLRIAAVHFDAPSPPSGSSPRTCPLTRHCLQPSSSAHDSASSSCPPPTPTVLALMRHNQSFI